MRILVIEDELQLLDALSKYLTAEGYDCETASDFNTGTEKALLNEYDCILLDITLPGGNGIEILQELKKKNPETGVIIISAKNSLDDRVKGLDLGADDYLSKPFHLSELNARLKSLIRRKKFSGTDEIKYHNLIVNVSEKWLKVNNVLVTLTKKEFDLLLFFLANPNRVVTKESIAEHLWGEELSTADSLDFIYSHVKNLRKKIIDKGGVDYIQTIYGMGYKFAEQ